MRRLLVFVLVVACADSTGVAVSSDASHEASGDTFPAETGAEARADVAAPPDANEAPVPIDAGREPLPPPDAGPDVDMTCSRACLEWDPALGYCVSKCRDLGPRYLCCPNGTCNDKC